MSMCIESSGFKAAVVHDESGLCTTVGPNKSLLMPTNYPKNVNVDTRTVPFHPGSSWSACTSGTSRCSSSRAVSAASLSTWPRSSTFLCTMFTPTVWSFTSTVRPWEDFLMLWRRNVVCLHWRTSVRRKGPRRLDSFWADTLHIVSNVNEIVLKVSQRSRWLVAEDSVYIPNVNCVLSRRVCRVWWEPTHSGDRRKRKSHQYVKGTTRLQERGDGRRRSDRSRGVPSGCKCSRSAFAH